MMTFLNPRNERRLSMRRLILVFGTLILAIPGFAHVTPNVQLVKRGEFIQESLPAAVKFSEKQLMIGGPDMAAIKKATGWAPSEEDAKIYVGRDAQGRVVGSAVFVWMPSEHGPVGIGVAFDASGTILNAVVTDVGTEPLAWVRPLLGAEGLGIYRGLRTGQAPDPSRIAPGVSGHMNRYYAEVIAHGVMRAQALERVSLSTPATGEK
jgi:hypothetical protein